jgi:hypothetical protein
MTESEWEIIERVAAIHGFVIHPDIGFGRIVTNKKDVLRSDFYWNESESFDEFFLQVYKFAYDNGYETAARW